MTGYMRRSRLARLLAAGELDEAMRKVSGMCAHCPDCGEELQPDGLNYWCPDCEASVTGDRVRAEGE